MCDSSGVRLIVLKEVWNSNYATSSVLKGFQGRLSGNKTEHESRELNKAIGKQRQWPLNANQIVTDPLVNAKEPLRQLMTEQSQVDF